MESVNKQTADADRAKEIIDLLDRFGDIQAIKVDGTADMLELMERIRDGRVDDEPSDDEQEDVSDVPGEPIHWAEKAIDSPVPDMQFFNELSSRMQGKAIYLDFEEVQDIPETVLRERIGEVIRDLVDEEEDDEVLDEEVEEEAEKLIEEMEEDEDEVEVEYSGHSGSTRKGITQSQFVEKGERKRQSIEFLKEYEGEWVNCHDFVEWANLDLPGGDTQESSVASAALSRCVRREYMEDVETRKVSDESRGWIKEYRYIPDGSESGSEEMEEEEDESQAETFETEEESDESREMANTRGGESSFENIPGTVEKGSRQHETLALLTHLTNRDDMDDAITNEEMAEVGRRYPSEYAGHLYHLAEKNLAEKDGQEGTRYKWKPTEGGKAELDRVGGFQLNS